MPNIDKKEGKVINFEPKIQPKSEKTKPTNKPKQSKNVVLYTTTSKQKDILKIKIEENAFYTYRIDCTTKGVVKKRIKNKTNVITQKITILTAPLILKDIYLTQNEKRLYYVQIGKEEVCMSKKELLQFIDIERNYTRISGLKLREIISTVLREYELVKKIEPKEIFPTIAVFLDKQNEINVVYPLKKQIYGENPYQRYVIKNIEQIGLDEEGELTEAFYNLLHLDTIPEDVRLITAGHTAISPFFYVLKMFLDIFPYHFWIVSIRSAGKTTTFEIFYNYLPGTEMKIADDIDSAARATKCATAHTTALNIDDVAKINPKAMTFMKAHGTKLKGRERMTKDQDLTVEETYACFVGTANSDEFLQGSENEAFRGRCLISTDYEKISNDANKLQIFNQNFDAIKTGKVYGYYFLQNAVEFIKKSIKNDNLTSYEKLVKLIKINKKKITKLLIDMEKPIIDQRRYTIYALVYTGLQFWKYVFETKGFQTTLIDNILKNKKNKLFYLIQKYEDIDKKFTSDTLRNVLDFFSKHYDIYGNYRNNENIIILFSDFKHKYNEWAVKKRYEPLIFKKLAEQQSQLLSREIKYKSTRFFNTITGEKFITSGLEFYYEDIRDLLGIEKDVYEQESTYITVKKNKDKEKSKKLFIDGASTELITPNGEKEESDDYSDQSELEF